MTVNYVKGDLFENLPNKNVILSHIMNDIGIWGSGFAAALGKHYPRARDYYLELSVSIKEFELGTNQLIKVSSNPDRIVCNMIAQHNVGLGENNIPPIRYDALISCLNNLRNFIFKYDLSHIEIHAPYFGTGLAGGNPIIIDELIKQYWHDLSVIIYTLE